MGTEHLREYARHETPQSEPLNDSQVENTAGGYVWEVDDWTRARRFLILGAEGGTFHIGERQLVRENAKALEKCIAEDGVRAVEMIRDVSQRGLAVNNDQALFALTLATLADDVEVRREAWRSLTTVARTGTHILHFASFRDAMGGWGRAAKRGVQNWYEDRDADRLAYQVIKYRQRDGWAHRDLLRLSHPKGRTEAHKTLYDFVHGRVWPEAIEQDDQLEILEGFVKAQEALTASDSAALIDEYGLPREAIKTEHLSDPQVLEALLENGMPMGAMIRNLANLTRAGVLKPLSTANSIVTDQLANSERLRKARIHPLSILTALRVYSRGRPVMGRGATWTPVEEIVDALDAAFYESFEYVEPSGKRTLIALDVSGSMTHHELAGMAGITPREGAAAMAMATVAAEPHTHTISFAGPYKEDNEGWGRAPAGMNEAEALAAEVPTTFPLTKRERLDDVAERMRNQDFGRTDCAVPMIYAKNEGIDVDTFVIYTDNETWAGGMHPSEALARYRRDTGINARLVVVGMEANAFTIADPNDAGMLDVVGFDSSAPALISAFSRGEV